MVVISKCEKKVLDNVFQEEIEINGQDIYLVDKLIDEK